MASAKPYRPRNQRLAPELYEQAGRVTFITISGLRPASPFTNDLINQAVIDALRTAGSMWLYGLYLLLDAGSFTFPDRPASGWGIGSYIL